MKKTFFILPIVLIFCHACAPFKFSDHRAAMCNELNSQIIFNGATQNTRASEIQQAERPLMVHSYDKKCMQ